jgi:hypothetical protein
MPSKGSKNIKREVELEQAAKGAYQAVNTTGTWIRRALSQEVPESAM